MKTYQLQHGDVIIKRIESLPVGVNPIQRQPIGLVVMSGESTGHHHVITKEGARLYELKGQMYLEVSAPDITITHEEHKSITIPEGIYEIGRVHEYDYFQEMERNIRD